MKQLAAPSSFTQATRLLRLTTPLGPDTLLAECVHGEEAISAGFRFTISALSLEAGLPLRSLLGQPALLALLTVEGGKERPFHGVLTGVELNGANGGMARYTLTLQPWTALLAHGRDSRVFQDMTVFDILDAVFAPYQGQGKLAPSWRFDLAERDAYPLRSLCTQYQESDLAFAERLMHEEGLFYFFEHQGDPASTTLGRHVMVIADHNGAFKQNTQPTVRFTQAGAVMKEDSMDRWRSRHALHTSAVEMVSWDYRTRSTRQVSAASVQPGGVTLASRDAPGPYAYADRSQGQRIAGNQLQAIDTERDMFTGAGTVRTLAPGTTFALDGHALHDQEQERSFLITRTVHLMHNNLHADLQGELHRQLGANALARRIAAEQADSLHATGDKEGQRPLYRNRIDAIRASLPFRASTAEAAGHGQRLHPRPSVRGQQSAIVVGPAGAVIHTDRDHRVKVQFHWQRGDNSHSRLPHPRPAGHRGAPADERAGTWVRVAAPLAPLAGVNWGSHALPRIGQEVLIDFLEGDIDRPVIIGALYNGAGQTDAQYNQVAHGSGAATGNAAAWFPGEAAAHAHPAVLSGIKSQAMHSSQAGAGGYSQLVFDDTPGQARVALQNHAGAHQGTAELNLGHLRHQSDNQRLAPSGFGAELKTEHSAALRAGRGMLLSSDARREGQGDQLDSAPAHAQVTRSRELQLKLADSARQHEAELAGGRAPEDLPAIVAMLDTISVLESTEHAGTAGTTGTAAPGLAGGQGEVSAYSAALLQVSSPVGIVATTPADAVLSSMATTSIVAGHDLNAAVQGSHLHAVGGGISLFTYGKASKADKPQQQTGMRLHAASGKLSTQSQSDQTRITADKTITVASTGASVTAAAATHTLLTAAGAYMKFEGNNIDLHGPGVMSFKAGYKELGGGGSSAPPSLAFPVPENWPDVFSQQINVLNVIGISHETGEALVHVPYSMRDKTGRVLAQGTTNKEGDTNRIFTKEKQELDLFLGEGEWRVFIDVAHETLIDEELAQASKEEPA